MSNWKLNKNSGPWPFQKQYDVWGYINNPRWTTLQQKEEVEIKYWNKLFATVFEGEIAYLAGSTAYGTLYARLYYKDTLFNEVNSPSHSQFDYGGFLEGLRDDKNNVVFTALIRHNPSVGGHWVHVIRESKWYYTKVFDETSYTYPSKTYRPNRQKSLVTKSNGIMCAVCSLFTDNPTNRFDLLVRTSYDWGKTWTPVLIVATNYGGNQDHIAIDVAEDGSIYLLAFKTSGTVATNIVGTFKSIDDGLTWTLQSETDMRRLGSSATSYESSLSIRITNGILYTSTMWSDAYIGTHYSLNYGVTWVTNHRYINQRPVYGLAQTAYNDTVVQVFPKNQYPLVEWVVHKSIDRGANFTQVFSFDGGYFANDPVNPCIDNERDLYVVTSHIPFYNLGDVSYLGYLVGYNGWESVEEAKTPLDRATVYIGPGAAPPFGLPELEWWQRNTADTHFPCGHWHMQKFILGVSMLEIPHSCFSDVDVKTYIDDKGQLQVWIAMAMGIDLDPNGMLVLVYDSGDRVWVPSTGPVELDWEFSDKWNVIDWLPTRYYYYPRMEIGDKNFWVWSLGYDMETTEYWGIQSLWVWKDGVITYRYFDKEYDDDNPPYDYGGAWYKTDSSNLKVTAAGVIVWVYEWEYGESGNDYQDIICQVSQDYGQTWTRHIIAHGDWNSFLGPNPECRADSSGNFYIMYTEEDLGVRIWKSVDSGSSWVLMGTLAIPEGLELLTIQRDYVRSYIDSTTEDLWIIDDCWQATSHPIEGFHVDFWKSTDSGVTWSKVATFSLGFAFWFIGFAVKGSMILVSATEYYISYGVKIYRSTDSGVNFGIVQDMTGLHVWNEAQEFKNDGDVWVWSGQEYHDPVANRLGFQMSWDNGATWEQVLTDISFDYPNTTIPVYRIFKEPQIWTLP